MNKSEKSFTLTWAARATHHQREAPMATLVVLSEGKEIDYELPEHHARLDCDETTGWVADCPESGNLLCRPYRPGRPSMEDTLP